MTILEIMMARTLTTNKTRTRMIKLKPRLARKVRLDFGERIEKSKQNR